MAMPAKVITFGARRRKRRGRRKRGTLVFISAAWRAFRRAYASGLAQWSTFTRNPGRALRHARARGITLWRQFTANPGLSNAVAGGIAAGVAEALVQGFFGGLVEALKGVVALGADVWRAITIGIDLLRQFAGGVVAAAKQVFAVATGTQPSAPALSSGVPVFAAPAAAAAPAGQWRITRVAQNSSGPVGGKWVELHDANGALIEGRVTASDGRVDLDAPSPGVYAVWYYNDSDGRGEPFLKQNVMVEV